MNNAVLNELGDQTQEMYFKCPSDDNLSGLGLPEDAAYPGAASLPLYQPPMYTPDGSGSGFDSAGVDQQFDPNALQKLISQPSPSGYAPSNTGAAMGPPAPVQTMMTPWGPITPINQVGGGGGFNPYALQTLATPAPSSSSGSGWASTLIKSFDTAIKAGSPAATAYINYTAQQQALRNQPIQVPGSSKLPGASKSSYTPWIVGGLAVAGILVALTVFSAKR